MAKKRLTGNNRTLSDDWEETLRQIRTQTAVDFTMTGEEKARKGHGIITTPKSKKEKDTDEEVDEEETSEENED